MFAKKSSDAGIISKKLRVVEHVQASKSNWNSKDLEWQKMMLLYDKKFSTVLTCMNFDKADEQNNLKEMEKYRREIYAIIDEAYKDFSKEIEKNEQKIRLIKISTNPLLLDVKAIKKLFNCERGCFLFENTIFYKHKDQIDLIPLECTSANYTSLYEALNLLALDKVTLATPEIQSAIISIIGTLPITMLEGKTVLYYLALIDEQIMKAKEQNKNPTELLELVLIKLAMLRDFSVGKLSYDYFSVKLSGKKLSSKLDEYIKLVLEKPLTEDTLEIKQLIGEYISFPLPCPNYPTIKKVIPVYSHNGSIGFNTILFAVFNDYYPVGFGVDPSPVHLNYFDKQSFLSARHDYGHVLKRVIFVRENYPEFFNQCRDIYFTLFQEKNANKISDKVFIKEILMLFFLIYDGAYYITKTRNNHRTVKDWIIKITAQSMESKDLLFSIRPSLSKYKREDVGLLKLSNEDSLQSWRKKLGNISAYILLPDNDIFFTDPGAWSYSQTLTLKKFTLIDDRLFPSEYDILEMASKEKIEKIMQLIEKIPNTLRDQLELDCLDAIDFIKPLQDIGYTFPDKEIIKNKPWKSLDYLQTALLDILHGFESRHPELGLNHETEQQMGSVLSL